MNTLDRIFNGFVLRDDTEFPDGLRHQFNKAVEQLFAEIIGENELLISTSTILMGKTDHDPSVRNALRAALMREIETYVTPVSAPKTSK